MPGPVESFGSLALLVVGDLMLDEEIDGTVYRRAPEAPVPVVEESDRIAVPGGAANVAARAAQLGARAAACGVVGEDAEGRRLVEALGAAGVRVDGVVPVSGRPTTVKSRVRDGGRMVVRVDRESREPLDPGAQQRVLDGARALGGEADAMVVSDYAKGVVGAAGARELLAVATEHRLPSVVDSKSAERSAFAGCTVLKLDEAALGTARPADVLAQLAGSALLVTMGGRGLALHRPGADSLTVPALAERVVEEAGAGDALCAALALALGAGADLEQAVGVAAAAAALAVESARASPLSVEALAGRLPSPA